MKTYKIPVSWEQYGYVNIEAESLEEALDIAETDDTIELPDGEYIHGSWSVDDVGAYALCNEPLNKRKEFSVVIHYEGAMHYDIEADNEEQAVEIAESLFGEEDCGNITDLDWNVCDVWENKRMMTDL